MSGLKMGRTKTLKGKPTSLSRNRLLIKALEYAYFNDFVDTDGFSEETLDRYMAQGYLTNKHQHRRVKNRQVYWISQKGVDLLRQANKIR